MVFYVGCRVSNFFYGKGQILELYKSTNEALVLLDHEVEGMRMKTINLNNLCILV